MLRLPQGVGSKVGGRKGGRKTWFSSRACRRTDGSSIRRHPISRAVLERNLSRYANRDNLSKLKGARPLIRGQALPYFRPFRPVVLSPPAFRHSLSLFLFLTVVSLRARVPSLFLSSGWRETTAGHLPTSLARLPEGDDDRVIAAKSRGWWDFSLLYVRLAPRKTKTIPSGRRAALWCPRICFSRRRGPNRSPQILHRARDWPAKWDSFEKGKEEKKEIALSRSDAPSQTIPGVSWDLVFQDWRNFTRVLLFNIS